MNRPMSVMVAAMLVASLAIVTGACSQGSPATDHYNRAGELRDDARWEEAIAELDQAIKFDPEFTMAYIARGNAHFSLEQFDQAVVDYSKAIALDPQSALAYANRGSAFAALGKNAAAKADYETARPLASDPAVLSQIDQGLAFASAFPKACQDARNAFQAWSAADHAAAQAGGNVIGHSLDLNSQVGQGQSENVQQLADELNADVQTALQLADEAARLRAAFRPPFDSCLPLITDLPEACADEIGQYPDVTVARTQVLQGQVALLEASTAVRDALIAGDQAAVDAAVDQVAAASDRLTASKDNWNDNVAPLFNAAVEACNAAIL